jgi:hypothetical protein
MDTNGKGEEWKGKSCPEPSSRNTPHE